MELLMFIGIAVGVGTVSGLIWFYGEQWMERREARFASEASKEENAPDTTHFN